MNLIESDYLETVESLFFAVKGIAQPPDRIMAYLRYAPDPYGERRRMGRPYRRLYHFADQEDFLRASHPQYLAYDPVTGLELQSVPHTAIAHTYTSRQRLQELRQQPHRDPVEEAALAFAARLQQISDLPWSSLGVSGSVLIGLHTPASDLDMTVHGEQDCWTLQRALSAVLDQDSGELRRLDEAVMHALHSERSGDTHMSYADFIYSERQKVIQGRFRDRPYFIRFLKEPAEYGEQYGDRQYTPLGRAEIEAVISDHHNAIFTPCSYGVHAVRSVNRGTIPEITEIVSFRGRFCEQARTGDLIRAAGTVERVAHQTGRVWHRLILGGDFADTMYVRR
jgi:predicted nucleotidyltransferase